MRLFQFGICSASLVLAAAANGESPRLVSVPTLTYADVADLALTAPIVAHVRVDRAVALKPEQAAGVGPGHTRFYIEASVVSVLRSGAEGVPGAVTYLADVRDDSSGKPARLRRKSEFVVFAGPVRGKPAELRLIAPDAQLPFTPQLGTRLRPMLREAAAPGAAPRIAGIGKAFHVAGSLPGESETQIFLQAADGRPISLTVLRRPGAEPQWAAALGEIVDEAAAAPARDTLLWYRLACTLPPALPPQSLDEADEASAAAIQADYRLIKERLGDCPRTRTRP